MFGVSRRLQVSALILNMLAETGLSVPELAEKLGLSEDKITGFCAGKRATKIDCIKIADATGERFCGFWPTNHEAEKQADIYGPIPLKDQAGIPAILKMLGGDYLSDGIPASNRREPGETKTMWRQSGRVFRAYARMQ